MKVGDKVSIREKSREIPRLKDSLGSTTQRTQVTWLELEKETFTGTVKTLPVREEVGLDVKEQLIVEFYSR